MLNLTLDFNCVISLEKAEPASSAVRKLIELHRADAVRVHVGLISASENVPGGSEPDYASFATRTERLGLTLLPTVLPEARADMSYVGFCVVGGDDDLETRVRAVVHPSSIGGYERFMAERGLDIRGPIHRRWRNMTCDIDGMVAHIRHGHDAFITSNTRDFVDGGRREALIVLGAGDVLTPEKAVQKFRLQGSAE